MAAPDREVFVLVGDGSYLMMAQELVTAVAEGIKLTVVLVQNHGYASIGALSESVGSQRFGTKYRYRGTDEILPVDLAANAASLGARALYSSTIEEFESALREAVASDRTTVVQIETDPLVPAPSSRRGGTCRWRRSPRSSPPAPRVRPTSATRPRRSRT